VSDTSTLNGLIAALHHREYARRQEAAQALLAWGPAAQEPLQELLEEGKNAVARVRAAELLGQRGDLGALLSLARVLERELDPDIRSATRSALILLEDKPVRAQVEVLLPALSSLAPEEDRTLALERLVRFWGRLGPEDHQRIFAAAANTTAPETAGWQGRFLVAWERLEPSKEVPPKNYPALPSAPEELVELITYADYATRTAAIARLTNLGEAALPALEKGLRSSRASCVRAIEALGKLRHPGAVPLLVEARRLHPGLASEIDSALLHLVEVLTDEPDAMYFGLYSRLVRDFAHEVPALATRALQAIIALARKHPERLHRTVLPLIKAGSPWGRSGAGPSLVRLAQELDQLTSAYKDLPIPADSSKESRDLPRPSQAE
jgi:hypothetical protein